MPKKPVVILSFEQWWEANNQPGQPMEAKRIWDAATALEREACAKLCDEDARRYKGYQAENPTIYRWKQAAVLEMASMIRGRTQTV